MNKVALLDIALEYEYFYPSGVSSSSLTIVLLHEGLGCVQMWKDFPQLLSDATNLRVLSYSRQGYGGSTPITGPRDIDFMRDEAVRVLPELLAALDIQNPILVGHSDGASIALLAAAHQIKPASVIVMAPHLFVEDISVSAISQTLAAFKDESTQMRSKLTKIHADVDGAFYGWADVWLKPEFLNWNIETDMHNITCPLLAIQGEQDQYGTMKQLDSLKAQAPHTQLLKLENCRHSPHFDQPKQVLTAIASFLKSK
jgi:pimeloyl-ACP methyl ester carboxylesterase